MLMKDLFEKTGLFLFSENRVFDRTDREGEGLLMDRPDSVQ